MILTFIDHDRGALNAVSLEVLTLARQMSTELGCPMGAILVGENSRDLAEQVQSYGVSQAYLMLHDDLNDYAPEAWAQSIVDLVGSENPEAIIAPGTDRGNEVLAHVAARLDQPMAANCCEVTTGADYQVTRVQWGGSLLEESILKGAPKLLSVAEHVVVAEEAPSADLALTEVIPVIDPKDLQTRIVSRDQPDSDKVSLSDAPIVVSGGRGVGSTEGFESLDELAALVGGAVGCSRAVTSNGWRPHADQVGQTGARVAPELYIACGISGAIQHIAGCKGAKQILVINTDPEAPILSKADYAVIGDLHEVLPAVSEAVRSVKS